MLPEGVIILLSSACYDDSPEPLPESLMQQTAGAVILVFDMICWAEPAMTQRCAAVLLERGTGCAALGTKQSEGIIQEWYKWNLFFFCSSFRSRLPISSPQPVRVLCVKWTYQGSAVVEQPTQSGYQITSQDVFLFFFSEPRERDVERVKQVFVSKARASSVCVPVRVYIWVCVCWLGICWSLLLGTRSGCAIINTGDGDQGRSNLLLPSHVEASDTLATVYTRDVVLFCTWKRSLAEKKRGFALSHRKYQRPLECEIVELNSGGFLYSIPDWPSSGFTLELWATERFESY